MSAYAYDAVLLVSFGGPEGPDDVMPFLRNVVRGRNVPEQRLQQVAKQYEVTGGVSPINAETRKLMEAVTEELSRLGHRPALYWGNRNWHPFLTDTMKQMARDGVSRAIALATSAYSSYSSCRQYLENIEAARAEVGGEAPVVDKIPPFCSEAGFVESNRARLTEALATLPEARVVFTAHSIPSTMAAGCDYERELEATARGVMTMLPNDWELAYQSRSGPPSVPWLEPDVLEVLERLANENVREVVLSPIGFVADHMEVIYDLDVQARARAEELGIKLERAKTVGTHPRFVATLAELVAKRLSGAETGACAPDCCPIRKGN